MTSGSHSDLTNVAVHTGALHPWPLEKCVEAIKTSGAGGVAVWPDVVEAIGVEAAGRILRDSGLRVPTLAGGGLFVGDTQAVDKDLRLLDVAEAIGAEVLTLLPGGLHGKTFDAARAEVMAGIEALLPRAEQAGVRLGFEPLHPMLADTMACVNTLADARRLCADVDHPLLGVAVDSWHIWWDATYADELAKLGEANRLFTYHVSDWTAIGKPRGLPGEGVIDFRRMNDALNAAGFEGMVELEPLNFDGPPAADDRLDRMLAAWTSASGD